MTRQGWRAESLCLAQGRKRELSVAYDVFRGGGDRLYMRHHKTPSKTTRLGASKDLYKMTKTGFFAGVFHNGLSPCRCFALTLPCLPGCRHVEDVCPNHARYALADDRAVPWRAHPRRHGRSRRAKCLLCRAGGWRRLEVDGLRTHLAADLRPASPPNRSAPSRLRRRMRAFCMWAAAKGCTGPICRSATVSTARRMRAKPGSISGCSDGQQIPALAVDPRDPNRVYAAVLGHPYGPNEERGIFRSTDGGATWKKVLYKDANTGGDDVVLDPANPNISCMRRCGSRAWGRGRMAISTRARMAVCSSPRMAATPGSR